jgi:hypothetical protein
MSSTDPSANVAVTTTFADSQEVARRQFQVFDLPTARRPLRPAGDPIPQRGVLPRVLAESDSALVGDLAGCLLEQETFVRMFGVDPPAEVVPGQGGVVLVRVEPEERQSKPVPPLERPVARPGVAPGLRQDAHDVAFEIDRLGRPCGPGQGREHPDEW